jgi:hypothetical protein
MARKRVTADREKIQRPQQRSARQKRIYRKRADNPVFILTRRMRFAIWRGLKGGKAGKSWKGMVDYSVEELKAHMERQFLPGMTWDNIGEWHIDHIVPLASFAYATHEDEEFKAAWSLTNLQPLWAQDNLKKNAKRVTLL